MMNVILTQSEDEPISSGDASILEGYSIRGRGIAPGNHLSTFMGLPIIGIRHEIWEAVNAIVCHLPGALGSNCISQGDHNLNSLPPLARTHLNTEEKSMSWGQVHKFLFSLFNRNCINVKWCKSRYLACAGFHSCPGHVYPCLHWLVHQHLHGGYDAWGPPSEMDQSIFLSMSLPFSTSLADPLIAMFRQAPWWTEEQCKIPLRQPTNWHLIFPWFSFNWSLALVVCSELLKAVCGGLVWHTPALCLHPFYHKFPLEDLLSSQQCFNTLGCKSCTSDSIST